MMMNQLLAIKFMQKRMDSDRDNFIKISKNRGKLDVI